VNGLRVIEVEHISDEEVLLRLSDFAKIVKVPENLVEIRTYGVYVVRQKRQCGRKLSKVCRQVTQVASARLWQ